MMTMGRAARIAAAGAACLALACQGDGGPEAPENGGDGPEPRAYRMGFPPGAPRPDQDLLLETIDRMSGVADVTIIQQPVPWTELLNGDDVEVLLQGRVELAAFLRLKGLEIVFLVDPLDGLDRTSEPPDLVAAGRSIREPDIRQMHEEWTREIARRVRPAWLGLASEINTLAAHGDADLYAEVRDLINTLAPQVRAASPATRVFVSFQVDDAWGHFGGDPMDHFALIDDYDIDGLGLSSYPGFVFSTAAEIPSDYFSRFDQETALPLLYVEGGWSSRDTELLQGSEGAQAQWLGRLEELLDGVNAELAIPLLFADLDIDALGLPPERRAALSNFAFMGIVDEELRPKAAYEAWKRMFARPLRP